MSFTVPQKLVDRLNTIFPRSEERVKIALSLLGYDHDLSRAEKQEIADSFKMNIRSVEVVLEKLGEENLFASDIGSVPLWRFNEKIRLSVQNIHPSVDTPRKDNIRPSIDTSHAHESELPVFPIGIPMDGKVLSDVQTDVDTDTDVDVKTDVQTNVDVQTDVQSDVKTDVKIPIISDVQMQELNAIKSRQEGFETVMRAELGSIKDFLQKAFDKPAPNPKPDESTTIQIKSNLSAQTKAESKQKDDEEVETEVEIEGEDVSNMVVPVEDLLKRSPSQIMAYINDLKVKYNRGTPDGEIPASDVSFSKVLLTLPKPLFSLYDQERYLGTIPQAWTFADYISFLGRDRMKVIYGFQMQTQQQVQQPPQPQSQMPQFQPMWRPQ